MYTLNTRNTGNRGNAERPRDTKASDALQIKNQLSYVIYYAY